MNQYLSLSHGAAIPDSFFPPKEIGVDVLETLNFITDRTFRDLLRIVRQRNFQNQVKAAAPLTLLQFFQQITATNVKQSEVRPVAFSITSVLYHYHNFEPAHEGNSSLMRWVPQRLEVCSSAWAFPDLHPNWYFQDSIIMGNKYTDITDLEGNQDGFQHYERLFPDYACHMTAPSLGQLKFPSQEFFCGSVEFEYENGSPFSWELTPETESSDLSERLGRAFWINGQSAHSLLVDLAAATQLRPLNSFQGGIAGLMRGKDFKEAEHEVKQYLQSAWALH